MDSTKQTTEATALGSFRLSHEAEKLVAEIRRNNRRYDRQVALALILYALCAVAAGAYLLTTTPLPCP